MLEPPILVTNKRLRLDQWLAAKYPAFSRSFLGRLCHEGYVTIGGSAKKAGYRLQKGDQPKVNVNFEQCQLAPVIDLPIIYKDDNVIVINKPEGIISHATGRYPAEESVASFIRQLTNQPGERAGLVHRLDRDTSGVMICAANTASLVYLQEQFAKRRVQKTYLALVKGRPRLTEATINRPIERSRRQPQSFTVRASGRPAITYYRIIQSYSEATLLLLKPLTGRTHQLRVHLSSLDHPIIGDRLYRGTVAERLMLHASELKLDLPGGHTRTFIAPLSASFQKVLASYEKS